jgi:hypothetical protein
MNVRIAGGGVVLSLACGLLAPAWAAAQSAALGGQPLSRRDDPGKPRTRQPMPPRADPGNPRDQEPLPPRADPGNPRLNEPLPARAFPGPERYREAPPPRSLTITFKEAPPPRAAGSRFLTFEEEMLAGLAAASLNVRDLTARDVIDVSKTDRLNRHQVAAVLGALEKDARASAAAEKLTRELRARGMLATGQRVIGVNDGKVYVRGELIR